MTDPRVLGNLHILADEARQQTKMLERIATALERLAEREGSENDGH